MFFHIDTLLVSISLPVAVAKSADRRNLREERLVWLTVHVSLLRQGSPAAPLSPFHSPGSQQGDGAASSGRVFSL